MHHAAQPYSILVIGGGFAGALTCVQLLRNARGPLRITLVEAQGEPGRGLAYGTTIAHHRLNVPAGKMSCLPDVPADFLEWSRAQQAAGHALLAPLPPVGADSFLPRAAYGDYVVQRLAEARGAARPDVSLVVEKDEALDLYHDGRQARANLLSDRWVRGDRVVLALGVLPSQYPVIKPLKFYHSARYVHFAWAPRRWHGLKPEDDVLLVGAGLTSLDLALELAERGHRGRILLLSRRGLHPRPHAIEPPWPAYFDSAQLPGTVRGALRKIRAEAARAAAQNSAQTWRAVLDALRPLTPALWQNWPVAERARFLRHVRPFWEVHRHRVAPEVARWLDELEAAKRLTFIAGRIEHLEEEDSLARVEYVDRKTQERRTLRVGKVVNCTGPRTDYTKFQHPLLISLLAQGLITHDPLALGIDATPAGAVKSIAGAPSEWLFTLGASMKGVLWETTAVAEIRVHAQRLAEHLLAHPPRA